MQYIKLFGILVLVTMLLMPYNAHAATPYETLAKGGAGGWLNVTRPPTEGDMKGRLLLLDFWTYGCVNCMQVVPDLSFLEEKYGDKLLVIGIHSAKYQGEQDSARILSAAKRFGLHHPVINDYDYAIWKSFGVNAWPTLILIGPDGQEISRYSGEGHRNDLDNDIAKNLSGVTNKTSIAALVEKEKQDTVLSFPARIEPFENGFAIADAGHNRILLTSRDGEIEMQIGSGEKGFKDGDYKDAKFNNPRGLKVVGNMIYVADTDNHRLRLIDLKDRKVRTVAGTGKRGYDRSVSNESALSVSLASPWDLEILPNSDSKKLVIASAGLHQLHVYDIPSGRILVLAGSGIENIKDGEAAKAQLAQPSGLTTDGSAIYFVDAESSALRELKDGQVKTLIGTGLFNYGLKDGTYPTAMLQHPQGLDYANGKIYVADTYNSALRVYDLKTGELSTLKWTGDPLGEVGDINIEGDMAYIVDTTHHKIEKLDVTNGKTEAVTITLPTAK
ncbi:MAG TPA: thioredoxin-like domain-containing protein [Alphaproteobacteria bacterium]|nr:thioredoxin-like domain-containing protein [Alphaproteobacteria bacterium]HNS44015.1 thioredoxin-like domain-containing protein [Alphaproteobacteria bacterium]